MHLAFIHIGRYDIKVRRHLAYVQSGIAQLGDWRMETWQLALRARCHVSIRQSPSLCNAILNTCPCLLAIKINWIPKCVSYHYWFSNRQHFVWSAEGFISQCLTPDFLNLADVAALLKKVDGLCKKNHCPISVLTANSKVFHQSYDDQPV